MSEYILYSGRTLESRVKARLRMSSEMGTFLLIDRFSHCHTQETSKGLGLGRKVCLSP